ncbi:hypothetical protein GGR52DRAFT_423595 [Hypoxylon sp. FL1284]|nr:hypothetical protein GGR52DRAFT_423595 [Hypoxylon sp. FL1284]
MADPHKKKDLGHSLATRWRVCAVLCLQAGKALPRSAGRASWVPVTGGGLKARGLAAAWLAWLAWLWSADSLTRRAEELRSSTLVVASSAKRLLTSRSSSTGLLESSSDVPKQIPRKPSLADACNPSPPVTALFQGPTWPYIALGHRKERQRRHLLSPYVLPESR